ncbi:serine hydrolase domain-containing protein [Streptomyces sp. NPDC051985]|uniref:serine hydrolase domain-containing protein n=1 Tax=Streptomyces sp. NPDC051985 TaxID=3155807 RepID=UPI003448F9E0
MTTSHQISTGDLAPGFEAVRAAFDEVEVGEGGAAFSAYLDGHRVVDLWKGSMRAGEPWREETVTTLFSASKALGAACAQVLHDRGRLDLDAPVTAYWPEFGQAGKEHTLVRHVLAHSSGVVGLSDPAALLKFDGTGFDDHDAIAAQLAAAEPAWTPGTKSSYHALTFGWLVGELVRRITGKTLGTFFHEEVAVPWGLDLWIGAPEQIHPRIADLHAPALTSMTEDDLAMGGALAELQSDPGSVLARTAIPMEGSSLLAGAIGFFGSPVGRSVENASAGAVGSARSLAKFYGGLSLGGEIDGVRLLSPKAVTAFATEQSRRPSAAIPPDLVVTLPSGAELRAPSERWGLGYQLNEVASPVLPYTMGPNPAAYGHPGMGGQFALADPDAGLGLGFVRSHAASGFGDGQRLRDAVYACLAG